jgi:hypothetical protein
MYYNITVVIGEYSFTKHWIHYAMDKIFQEPEWINFFKEYNDRTE